MLTPVAFPAYQKTPFKQTPSIFMTGEPSYMVGQFNDDTGPTYGNVISDSGNGTTATLTFQIKSGNIPLVGALITVISTGNASGAYNVTNAVISSVSTTLSGICTVMYPATGTSSVALDSGEVLIPQPEIPCLLPSVLQASSPTVFNFQPPILNQGRTITIYATFPILDPTASFALVLQEALQDYDTEYQNIGTIAVVVSGVLQNPNPSSSTGALSVQGVAGRFYRILVCGESGGAAAPTTPPNAGGGTTQVLVKGIA